MVRDAATPTVFVSGSTATPEGQRQRCVHRNDPDPIRSTEVRSNARLGADPREKRADSDQAGRRPDATKILDTAQDTALPSPRASPMTTGRFNANDRVHLAVNLSLMVGMSALAAWFCWTAVPLKLGWRLACSAIAFGCAWWMSNWLVPRLTGMTIERLFGRQASKGDQDDDV